MATHIIPFEHTGRVQDPLLLQHRIEKMCSGLQSERASLTLLQGRPSQCTRQTFAKAKSQLKNHYPVLTVCSLYNED